MGKKKQKKFSLNNIPDILVAWVGTTNSLISHTAFFILSFLSHWIFGLSLDIVLLILTTIVSLEAIYLAIFIQRSVNQQASRLSDVEESLDDVEESLDDVEESLGKKGRVCNHPNASVEKSLEQIIQELKDLKINLENKG